MSVKEKLTALANKIRSYTGKTALIGLDDMTTEIDTVAVAMPNALISRAYETLVIPKGCNAISAYAFYYANKKLKSVSVESTRLNGVYSHAFYHCDLLEEFRIADKCNIRRFGGKAFNTCSKLKVIDLTNYSGTDIPVLDSIDAFGGTHADCVIIVPAKLYNQWISATNWSAIADMIVPDLKYSAGVTYDTQAAGGTALRDVTGFGVSKVGHESVRDVNVTSPVDGKTVVCIGNDAFERNPSIKRVTVDVENITIGSYAFYNCTSLESVIFKKTPKKIRNSNFRGTTHISNYKLDSQ